MSTTDDQRPRLQWPELVHDDDDDHPPERQCATCKIVAPATPSAHTLISAKFGWRLQRTHDARGAVSVAWLCPRCWAARRIHVTEQDGQAPPSPARPRVQPSSVAAIAEPADIRSTGAIDMVSSMCRSLLTKLRSRAHARPKVNRLLRAVTELETEIGTWAETPGTPERRKELWAELLERNREADALIDAQHER